MGNDALYILLADDDSDDRLFFKDAMEDINPTTLVSFVNDGSHLMYFLNLPGIRLPDILFLDLNMPVKNGMECLKEIRANTRFKDMVIVIYSTSGSDHDMNESSNYEANAYIKKPNNFADLKASLAMVIDRSAQTKH